MRPYVFHLHTLYKPKIWGGDFLRSIGRRVPDSPAGQGIGEAWELADLDSTSPTGGGGEPARSIVANGPWAGKTLRQLIAQFGPALIGDVPTEAGGAFPLLIKILDARENLSIQVHPSAAYVAAHPRFHLKHEGWYILHAAPGAAIYNGLKPGVTRRQLTDALGSSAVESLFNRIPIRSGDFFYLPSGTPHALGAGSVVVEIQTPSDTTFRLYDWGRASRPLQIESALECMSFESLDPSAFQPSTRNTNPHAAAQALCLCDHFRIDKLEIPAGRDLPLETPGQPRIIITLQGAGRFIAQHQSVPSVPYRGLQTFLLPADPQNARLHPESPTAFLQVTFPQASHQRLA